MRAAEHHGRNRGYCSTSSHEGEHLLAGIPDQDRLIDLAIGLILIERMRAHAVATVFVQSRPSTVIDLQRPTALSRPTIALHSSRRSCAAPELMSISENRKALHDYFIEEKFEAGIALEGWEVKAIRAGRCS